MGKRLHGIKLTATLLFAGLGLLLAAVSLPFTGWRALSVQTGSMKPAIDPGALVLVHRVSPDSLRKGDVITYKSKLDPKATVTHRIVERKGLANGPKQTILKGDANKVPDAPINDPQIVGRVVASVPYVGHVLDVLKTPLGLALCIYLPIILIFVSEIRLLVRRLMQLELAKQQPAVQAAGASPAPEPAAAPATEAPVPPAVVDQAVAPTPRKVPAVPTVSTSTVAHTPASPARKPRRRMIGGMGVALLLAGVSASLVTTTFAALEGEASLTANSITTQEVVPPEEPSTLVLIDRVYFGDRWREWYRGRSQWQYEPTEITLYGAKKWRNADLTNWTLESSAGTIYRLRHRDGWDGRTLTIEPWRLNILNTSSDYLVLKDTNGTIVDGISWGQNISQLSPAIRPVGPGDAYKRIRHVDTNAVADWRRIIE